MVPDAEEVLRSRGSPRPESLARRARPGGCPGGGLVVPRTPCAARTFATRRARPPAGRARLLHIRAVLAHRLALGARTAPSANSTPSQIDLAALAVVLDSAAMRDQRTRIVGVTFNSIVGLLQPPRRTAGSLFLTSTRPGSCRTDCAIAEFHGALLPHAAEDRRRCAPFPRSRISVNGKTRSAPGRGRQPSSSAVTTMEALLGDRPREGTFLPASSSRSSAVGTRVLGSHCRVSPGPEDSRTGQRMPHLGSGSTLPLGHAFTCNSRGSSPGAPCASRAGRPVPAGGRAALCPRAPARDPFLPIDAMKTRLLAFGLTVLGATGGCASPTIPGSPSTAELAADQARREERLKIMQQYWAEQTGGPPEPPVHPPATAPVLDYPAGNYSGINFAQRRTADPGLVEAHPGAAGTCWPALRPRGPAWSLAARPPRRRATSSHDPAAVAQATWSGAASSAAGRPAGRLPFGVSTQQFDQLVAFLRRPAAMKAGIGVLCPGAVSGAAPECRATRFPGLENANLSALLNAGPGLLDAFLGVPVNSWVQCGGKPQCSTTGRHSWSILAIAHGSERRLG